MAYFTDKVVVVTGASEGIGRALCLDLAANGAKVVLAARSEKRLNSLKLEIENKGGTVLSVPTDVTQEHACRGLVDRTVAEFDRIDILVNNAGRTMWTMFDDIKDLSVFDKIIQLNYLGCVYCTYHALPYIKKTKGLIVGVSSLAGLTGIPARTAYAASKHAMVGFFDSLRIELRGSGVDVTMIAPDFVLSEIHRRALDGFGKPLGESPLQESKIMTAEKCASLIMGALEKRQRVLITSLRGKVGRWIKLIAPGLVDKVAAKAIEQKK